MAENTYNVAYSTNARAKCKYSGCGETIAKDELRFTKSSPSAFSDKKPKCDFFHAKCMFLSFVRARKTTKIIEKISDIEGFDSLNQADKDLIKKCIKEYQSGSMKDQIPKITRKRKADGEDDEAPKKKRVNPDNKKKTKKTDDVLEMVKSKKNIKVGDSDSDDDDFPLKSKMTSKGNQIVNIDDSDEDNEPIPKIILKDDKKTKPISKPKPKDSDDEDDQPVKMKISKPKAKDSDDEDEDDKPFQVKSSKFISKAKDSDDESDEDELIKKILSKPKSKAKDSDDEDEDDEPVKMHISKSKPKAKDSDDESEDDEPVKMKNSKSKAKSKAKDSEDEDSEYEPKSKKSRQVKPKEDSDDEDEDEEVKESNSDNENGILSGKVFALCGKLSMPTEKIVALIEKNGGKYSKTITKAVTHVIAAKPEADKTKKLQKAKEEGKIIVNESFLKRGQ